MFKDTTQLRYCPSYSFREHTTTCRPDSWFCWVLYIDPDRQGDHMVEDRKDHDTWGVSTLPLADLKSEVSLPRPQLYSVCCVLACSSKVRLRSCYHQVEANDALAGAHDPQPNWFISCWWVIAGFKTSAWLSLGVKKQRTLVIRTISSSTNHRSTEYHAMNPSEPFVAWKLLFIGLHDSLLKTDTVSLREEHLDPSLVGTHVVSLSSMDIQDDSLADFIIFDTCLQHERAGFVSIIFYEDFNFNQNARVASVSLRMVQKRHGTL